MKSDRENAFTRKTLTFVENIPHSLDFVSEFRFQYIGF